MLESPLTHDHPVDVQVSALFDLLEGHIERIGRLAPTCAVEVWLGLTSFGTGRLHDLTPETLLRLGDMGAALILDVYGAEDQ